MQDYISLSEINVYEWLWFLVQYLGICFNFSYGLTRKVLNHPRFEVIYGNSISPISLQPPLSFPFPCPYPLPTISGGFHGSSGKNLETSQPRLIHQIISAHRTDAIEIVKGQWPLGSFYAFFSSVSLLWEVLPTATTTVIVPTFSPVVQIKSADSNVLSVRTTTNVDPTSNAVMANASVVGPLVPVRTTSNVTVASSAVKANALVRTVAREASSSKHRTTERDLMKVTCKVTSPSRSPFGWNEKPLVFIFHFHRCKRSQYTKCYVRFSKDSFKKYKSANRYSNQMKLY